MPIINVLDKNTINQIAAGEVIERPASVVKELVENSIDAGATAVSVEIHGGGIDLIRITDNGSGIEPDDVRTAFLRHATSKIKDASDLADVMSLGFRGEALASIASVSEVELLTRRKGDVNGIRYRISGGEELGLESVGCPEGTTFIVRNLFGNVPVRRKFLKSATTEGSMINELIEKIAISHPEVSIKFINNSRTVIFTTGSNSIRDIIYGIYGREITASLLEVKYGDEAGIRVSGFVAKPVVARSNRNLEHYYVNGRYIRSNVISKAIEQAFAPYLMLHKYPFTALHIEIPANTMDVNVHPTKQEVRFEKPDDIFTAVYKAVCDTLTKTAFIPKTVTPKVESQKEAREKILADLYVQKAPEPFEKRSTHSASGYTQKTVGETSYRYPENGGFENGLADKTFENGQHLINNDAAQNRTEEMPRTVNRDDDLKLSEYRKSNAAGSKPDEVSNAGTGNDEDILVTGDMSGFAREITSGINTDPKEAEKEDPGKNVPLSENDNISDLSEGPVYTQLVMETDIDRQDEVSIPVIRPETKEEFKSGMYDGFKLIGQIFNTYWIVELKDKLYMIDQHAAHEKVIYERLIKEYNESSILTQSLSPALIISLSASECAVV
ncbi:MAG: DNA mismatch repair endonuclease MutL, partial [Lachnospiraceae bacterium]|nr:DNA mismatch repair endonuclease MutL [Lachnospiraceae bacterium]